ncbi:MAG: EamA family transporter RarD [Alphaproteobacteria bacterium]|nr:EamA family transporter RarD [Alphaproteobacteria bacterium]
MDRAGFISALACFLIWGLVPLYFHMLRAVGAIEVVAHRIIWSVLLLTLALAAQRQLPHVLALLRTARALLGLMVTAALVATNWLIYIWAVSNNHVLASSLGYFLNPLVNVLLGVAVLGERLRKLQIGAVALAALGVAIAAAGALSEAWISVSLALSFALYGLVRKLLNVAAMPGLYVETLLLAPLSLAYLTWLHAQHRLYFGHVQSMDALLIGSAIVTTVPLALFGAAVRRLPYATVGLLQYISPSLQFLTGWLVFGEPLRASMVAAFALIWVALALFSIDLIGTLRAPRALPSKG